MSTYPLPIIPSSKATVSVSIIDSSARLKKIPINVFFEPELPGFTTFDGVANVFLITHTDPKTNRTRRVLFDLGMRKDWTKLPPSSVERIKTWECDIQIAYNVSEILTSYGLEPSNIEAIIWSHAHFDHTGDPSTFPPHVDLIVGPGIKSAHMPGYPSDPKSPVLETAFSGRTVHEVSFDTGLSIGSMLAIDFFGDGSFYLLDAPGHAIGHVNALARTTVGTSTTNTGTPKNEDTFILMTGDAFHHPGALRPNPHTPLPTSFPPSSSPSIRNPLTPSTLLSLHPTFSPTTPLFRPSRDPLDPCASHKSTLSPSLADDTIAKIQAFDALDNVFVVAAHDTSLQAIVGHWQDGVDANDWKVRGWKEQGKWAWAGDLEEAVRVRRLGEEGVKEVAG